MTAHVPRILLLSCIACVAAIAAIPLVVPDRWDVPEMVQPDLDALVPPKSLFMPGREFVFQHAIDRPLFVAGRRPPAPPTVAEATEPEPEPFPKADLLGVFGSGASKGVILMHEGKATRVQLGANWSGWNLTAVDPKSSTAVFSAPRRGQHTLQLRRQPQQGAMVYVPESVLEAEEPAPAEAQTEAVAPGEAASAASEAEPAAPQPARRSARTPRPPRESSGRRAAANNPQPSSR